MQIAEKGMAELSEQVDSLITVPNEKLLEVMGPRTSLLEAFAKANDVLLGAVQGIADLIIRPGIINVDFADVKTIMSEMGSMAMMGAGIGTGESRAREAAEKAIRSPLLDNINLQGARGILVNITANESMELGEFSEVGDTVNEFASDNATVVVGTVIDESMGDELRVTVVATGLGEDSRVAGSRQKPVLIDGAGTGSGAYQAYERPTHERRKGGSEDSSPAEPLPEPAAAGGPSNDRREYLDIPTFLRRQAD